MPEFHRREFLKLVGASAGAAATVGCEPVNKLIPYVIQPEEIVPGIADHYASTCQECPAGCGLLVKTREGRPIKLDGNPKHPINKGSLCARGQASIGSRLPPGSPSRSAEARRRQARSTTWEDTLAILAAELKRSGNRTWVLGGETGPTASTWIDKGLGPSPLVPAVASSTSRSRPRRCARRRSRYRRCRPNRPSIFERGFHRRLRFRLPRIGPVADRTCAPAHRSARRDQPRALAPRASCASDRGSR